MWRYWRGICQGQQGGKSGEGDRVGQRICDAAPGPSGKWKRALRRGEVDMARGGRLSVYHVGAGMQCPEWGRERVICGRRWARAGCGVRLIYRLSILGVVNRAVGSCGAKSPMCATSKKNKYEYLLIIKKKKKLLACIYLIACIYTITTHTLRTSMHLPVPLSCINHISFLIFQADDGPGHLGIFRQKPISAMLELTPLKLPLLDPPPPPLPVIFPLTGPDSIASSASIS